MQGFVHSIQSMGTLDGPGVRFVVFAQGCPLRCKCCHNPDTWEISGGTEYTPQQIVARVLRCRDYFGEKGGITISGGEPLLQPDFCRKVFELCREEGINTCLDTSGCLLNPQIDALLEVTDRVLLDIKYHTDDLYKENAGCGIDAPLAFLEVLSRKGIPVTLRQVIIPGLSDGDESVLFLRGLRKRFPTVDSIELLPFRKICQVKYDSMGIVFPLEHTDEPTAARMNQLNALL